MPVGIFRRVVMCTLCGQGNSIIETPFLVCQVCKGIQKETLDAYIKAFIEWATSPCNGHWGASNNPLEHLVMHLRNGGSHHRFDDNKDPWFKLSIHPSRSPCLSCWERDVMGRYKYLPVPDCKKCDGRGHVPKDEVPA